MIQLRTSFESVFDGTSMNEVCEAVKIHKIRVEMSNKR